MISGSQMDGGTWSTVIGTFKKAPSLVGADVVTDIKIYDLTEALSPKFDSR